MKIDKKKVVQALVGFGDKIKFDPSFSQLRLPKNKKATEFLFKNPNAFLFGVIFAQGIRAEKIWEAPWILKQRLGHFDIKKIAKIDKEKLVKILLQKPALHRFPNAIAKALIEAADILSRKYKSNASNIWERNITAPELYKRLIEFRGIGQKKAAMAILILFHDFKIPIKNLEESDVAYDVHIRRVFKRTGLVNKDSLKEIIKMARRLYPKHPGALDFPAWVIGRTWCHPQKPNCPQCVLQKVCKYSITNLEGR